jgi:hypothetical protein
VGDQDLMVRVGFAQSGNKTLRGAGFTNRDGVKPYNWLVRFYGIKAETLTNVAQIFRLFARTPKQVKKNVGQ